MGQFLLAVLIAGAAAVTEGKSILTGASRELKAAWVTTAVLGLVLTLAAALGLADAIADKASQLLRGVLPQ